MDVKLRFVLRARRAVAWVAGGSFRASRLGLRRFFKGLGGGGWMLNVACFFGCVDWLPASREALLGRRTSESVVASKVWGCVGGCKIVFCSSGASVGCLRRGRLV